MASTRILKKQKLGMRFIALSQKTSYSFDSLMNHRRAVFPDIFPNFVTEEENRVIVVGGYGRKEFAVLNVRRYFRLQLFR